MYCEDAGEATLPEQLLADICRVFAELRVDRITSNDLCEQLGDLESRPWANLNDGFRLSPNKLAICRVFAELRVDRISQTTCANSSVIRKAVLGPISTMDFDCRRISSQSCYDRSISNPTVSASD
jgi:hypothetical protein